MKLLILNGPNLNLLGQREENIYGKFTLSELENELRENFPTVDFDFYQSNIEGEIINKLHSYDGDAIVINAGGYTHTSVAIADALTAIKIPYTEVHISNVYAREEYRHVSFIAKNAVGVIAGFGKESYKMAIDYFVKSL